MLSKPVVSGLQADLDKRLEKDALRAQIKAYRSWLRLAGKFDQTAPVVPGYASGGTATVMPAESAWIEEAQKQIVKQLPPLVQRQLYASGWTTKPIWGDDWEYTPKGTRVPQKGLNAPDARQQLEHEIAHAVLSAFGVWGAGDIQHQLIFNAQDNYGSPLFGLRDSIYEARKKGLTNLRVTPRTQGPNGLEPFVRYDQTLPSPLLRSYRVTDYLPSHEGVPGYQYGGEYDLLGFSQHRPSQQYTDKELAYMRAVYNAQNPSRGFDVIPGRAPPAPAFTVQEDTLAPTIRAKAAELNPAAAQYEDQRAVDSAMRPSNAWEQTKRWGRQQKAKEDLATAALAKLSDADLQAVSILAEELQRNGVNAGSLQGYFKRRGRGRKQTGMIDEPVEYALNAARERLQLTQEKQREMAIGKSPELALQELAGTLTEQRQGNIHPTESPLGEPNTFKAFTSRSVIPDAALERVADVPVIGKPLASAIQGSTTPLGIAAGARFGGGLPGLARNTAAITGAGAVTAPLGPVPQQIAMTAADVAVGGPSAGTGERVAEDVAGGLERNVPDLARTAERVAEPPRVSEPEVPFGGKAVGAARFDPVARLKELIDNAKPLRGETEKLMSQERARRAGAISGMQGTPGGRGSYYQQLSALKGELPKVQFEPPENLLLPEEMDHLFNMVWQHPKLRPFQKISTATALNKTILGQLPTRGEIAALEEVFGKELAEAIARKRPLGQRAWENLMDTIGLPRSLLSAFDLSAPLRQGLVLSAGHPLRAGKAFGTMLRATVSEKYAKLVDDAIRFGPNAELKESSGLYLANWTGVARNPSDLEETFMSRLADKIPGIRMSNRAYVTYLNKLRSDVFDDVVKGWAGRDRTHRDFEMLSRYINHATGRGDIPKQLTSLTPLMNAAFFSPRLVMSRFQLPADLVFTSQPVRTMIAKDLLATVGTGVAILTLADAAGIADVELDPRSPDFGKMKMGGQRLDFWGGFQPVARYTAQIASGQAKSRYGNLYDVDRSEVFTRFLRSKLSPVASLAADVATGKTFTGDEMSYDKAGVKGQLFNRLTPLFIQDMIESSQVEGMKGGMRSLAGLFGVNVQAYKDPLAEAFAKYYPDLAPYDPEKHAAIIDTDERLRSLVEPGAKEKETAKIAEDFAQTLRTLAGPIRQGDTNAGRVWRDAYADFQKQMVGVTAAEYFGTEFPSPDTPEGKIISEYYLVSPEQFRDPETFEVDWDAFQAKRDGLLSQLPQQIQDAIEAKTKLPEDLQDVEQQYRRAKELRNQLGDISPLKGVTKEQYDGLNEIWTLATEIRKDTRRQGRDMDTETGIRKAAAQLGVSPTRAIQLRAGTKARENARNPEYVNFLVANAETPLALFYPELYSANWVIDAVNRAQGKQYVRPTPAAGSRSSTRNTRLH